ncbi:hypothetical protein [Paraburkholderia sp. GAS334]|uniref:hypothetical protein n=1 Tax=Paraburkholderia sp. GAS334 TaxID=3035131 RepID=UPI003D1F1C1F
MKTALVIIGGAICMSTWQANAAETATNPSSLTSESVINSEGPDFSTHSMSGSASVPYGKSRADVYQDLVHSKSDGEAAQMQKLFRGSR